MPQTLLALLAIMIVTTFSAHQQMNAVKAQRQLIGTEMEIMANAIGTEKINYLLTKGFDEAMNGQHPETMTTSDLTRPENFDRKDTCWQDVDECDFVGMFDSTSHTAAFEMYSYVEGVEISFDFTVETDVYYVTDDGAESADPTWTKQVLVLVEQEYLAQPVIFTRNMAPLDWR